MIRGGPGTLPEHLTSCGVGTRCARAILKIMEKWVNSVVNCVLVVMLIVVVIQTCSVTYEKPMTGTDERFVRLMDSVLDLSTRVSSLESENAVLFRMLRTGTESIGVTPDRGSESSPFVLPPGRIGDAGSALGDEL